MCVCLLVLFPCYCIVIHTSTQERTFISSHFSIKHMSASSQACISSITYICRCRVDTCVQHAHAIRWDKYFIRTELSWFLGIRPAHSARALMFVNRADWTVTLRFMHQRMCHCCSASWKSMWTLKTHTNEFALDKRRVETTEMLKKRGKKRDGNKVER